MPSSRATRTSSLAAAALAGLLHCTSYGGAPEDTADAGAPPPDALSPADASAIEASTQDAKPPEGCPGADTRSDPQNCGACKVSCFGARCIEGRCEASVVARLKRNQGLLPFAVTEDALYVASYESGPDDYPGVQRLPKDVTRVPASGPSAGTDVGLPGQGFFDLATLQGTLFSARFGLANGPSGIDRYLGATGWTKVHDGGVTWLFPVGNTLLATAADRHEMFFTNGSTLAARGSHGVQSERFCSLGRIGDVVFGATNGVGLVAATRGASTTLTFSRVGLEPVDVVRQPLLLSTNGSSGVVVVQPRDLTSNEGECLAVRGGGAVYRLAGGAQPAASRAFVLSGSELVRGVAQTGSLTYLAAIDGALFTVRRCSDAGVCAILYSRSYGGEVLDRALVLEGNLLFFRFGDELRLVDARPK